MATTTTAVRVSASSSAAAAASWTIRGSSLRVGRRQVSRGSSTTAFAAAAATTTTTPTRGSTAAVATTSSSSFCWSRRSSSTTTTTTTTTRLFSSSSSSASSSTTTDLSFETSPLGKNGAHLLKGLDVYQVPSKSDGHPLAVFGIHSQEITDNDKQRIPVLLLHGRTWSSIPVYHLLGGSTGVEDTTLSSRSVLEALWDQGLQPYAMDFRGFGGTHPDATGYVEPLLCVTDTESVLEWMAQRHNLSQVNLLGWSQGALVAQLTAQKLASSHKEGGGVLNKLILYGSIYDPLVRYPREPLYRLNSQPNTTFVETTFDMAIEDFTLEGSIPPEPAKLFAQAALTSDPIKAVWKHLYQFNNCDPARVQHATLVIGGDQDPYAPLRVQQELFGQLGRGAGNDRVWAILADCDHAVHLLNHGRQRFIQHVVHFLQSE